MKRILVGAPLLGQKKTQYNQDSNIDHHHLEAWRTFAPFITNPQQDSKTSERLVLLPNSRFISVLAYKTGKRIATILPSLENEQVPVEITAVTLVSTNHATVQDLVSSEGTSDYQILVLACNDGSLRMVFLDILRSKAAKFQNCGPYWISGDCYRPQQVLQLRKKTIIQSMEVGYCLKDQVALYAITKDDETMSLHRFMLPSKYGKTKKKKLDSSCIICLESNLTIISGEETTTTSNGTPEYPFSLSVCKYEKDTNDQRHVGKPSCSVLVVAFPSSLVLFMEKNDETGTRVLKPFKWNITSGNSLTAVAIAPNKKDIACGYARGTIRVLVDLIPRVEEYNESMVRYEAQQGAEIVVKNKKPRHPTNSVLVRKLHWHAHPVSTLAFDSIHQTAGDSMLYSGAEESVIVTWQLSRGTDKPAEVLPRVALGGIVHIICSHRAGEADTLLAYCADNSLHLFETHNQHLKWKVQGLGAGEGRTILSKTPKMVMDPTSKGFSNPRIICAGLTKAAGNIQIYDVKQQEVVSTIHVAPFNRVSRMKSSQCVMPAPTIIHAEWDTAAKHLLTVDTVPTENSAVGVSERLEDGTMIGTVSTIRFWKFNENSLTFDPIAAMASPHGSRARVSSVALSPDGKYACSVSNDEKAFRMWRRSSKDKGDDWNCIYRIQFPSGYANFSSGPSGVCFSEDASVLAIAFGSMVTLWDRHNVTLLSSLQHGDGNEDIQTIRFLQSGELEGMLIIQSSSALSLQSPYANRDISSRNWLWTTPSENWTIRSLSPLADIVSIILLHKGTNKSRVILLDTKSGLQRNEPNDVTYDDEIECMVTDTSQQNSNGWENKDTSTTALYTLCSNGEITCLAMNDDRVDMEYIPQPQAKVPPKNVPTLELHLAGVTPAKRLANVLTISDLNGIPKRQKLSIENFGAFVGEEAPVASLPRLTGSFVRAFVSRNLLKN